MNTSISEIFYGILFAPSETFKNFSYEKPYKLPVLLVMLASMFLLLLGNENFTLMTIFVWVGKTVGLATYWIFFAFFVDLMARMFNLDGNFSKLLTLTSLTFVPWIFIAPLKLLKNSHPALGEISIILLLGVWFWTVALQILAVSETYNIPRKNAIIILLLPFLGWILYFIWMIDFFVKLFQFSSL